ncbi:MAG TPA: hemerythrin domain-containing protein [Methanobacterium sp.]|nr:hemerythrin domain-containing protein [Methanobacterium sp.]
MTEDLYKMLKDDHDTVITLLREATENEESSRFREIKNQLNLHMESEEKFFYPRVKPIDEDGINRSFKEHDEARQIIKDMENIHWKDEEWMDKLKKLKETVEEHVEKEEDIIFPESERLTTLQREEIAQKIEEEKKSKKLGSIPNSKLVPLPEYIDVPVTIPSSRVKIPLMYAEGDVEYEDDGGNKVSKENATHIRLTGIDGRTDIVVGPVENEGMIKLTMYQNDENRPTTKEKATKRKSKIFNEEYRPVRTK